jgi:hypothetical protein
MNAIKETLITVVNIFALSKKALTTSTNVNNQPACVFFKTAQNIHNYTQPGCPRYKG